MKLLRALTTGAAAGVVIFGLACGEPVGPPKQVLPAAMQVQGGNAQNATVTQPLPSALEVRVVDSDGNPVSGVAVTWSVTSGGGSVVAESPATSSSGTARAAWTLGRTSGSQSVTAKAGGLTQVFTATANPDRPAVITATPDSLLLDAVGDSARASFVVADQHGNVHATAALSYALGAAADSSVTTVDAAGFAHARGAGRVLLTVSSDTARLQLPVNVAPVIAALRFGGAPACLAAVGDTVRLTATAEDRNAHAVADAELHWSVRDTAVVVMDSTGLVRARANGTAYVIAAGVNARGERTDSVQVCVAQAVARVELTPAFDTLRTIGAVRVLTAAAYDARGAVVAGAALTWTSLDTTIAALQDEGADTVRVSARMAGSTQIVVAAGGAVDTAAIVVHPPVAAVVIAQDSVTLAVNDTIALSAEARDAAGGVLSGRAIAWATSDAAIATVDTAGRVSGVAAGRAIVTATSEGMQDSVVVVVSTIDVGSIAIVPDSALALEGDTLRLVAVTLSAQGDTLAGRTVTWASADTVLATVDVSGLVTARSAGQVSITGTSEGVSDTAVVTITVRPVASLVLSADTLQVAARDTVSLTATLANDQGTPVTGRVITWVSADTAVAVVSDSGVITGVAEGTTWITATSESAVDSAFVIVGPVPVARVIIAPDSAAVYLGATATFTATTTAARGDTLAGRAITWTALDTAIVSIDGAGLVTPKAVGRTSIIAASEGKADTAIVTVRSPISRIVLTPDTLTLTAVGQTQAYLAAAYDTLDNPMTGVTFTWRSANPLVATVSPSSGASTTATAEGSGVTQITATAMGQVGMASLRVGQYAASIDAAPDTVRISVGGSATLSATVRDGNGALMNGATTIWKAQTAVATVDSLTGAVRGTALGTERIVARVYNPTDTVVSDTVVVMVVNDAPPAITFAANAFTVGRFANISIPVYLSTAPSTKVTVLLTSADTAKGKFSSTKVTFNAGQTQANASFNGLAVGSVQISAADSAGVYAGDNAIVNISIKAELSIDQKRYTYFALTQYYPSIIQGDRVVVDLRLSDPAPTGGLYFTVDGNTHSTPEPATVFVPAGQLATSFDLIATSPDSGTIRASAPGTTSASHLMRVVPANFNIWSDPGGGGRVPYTIGLGQVNDSISGYSLGIRTPLSVIAPVTAGVTLGTPGIIGDNATSVLIATGTSRTGYPFKATALGRTTISASSPGWTSDVDTILVTSPKIMLSNSSYGAETYVGVGRGSMYATLTDSMNRTHYAGDTVRFNVWSGDTAVVKVESDTGVILPGQSMPPGQYLYMQAVGGGSTYVYSGAAGYITDSIAVNVRVPKISATGYFNSETAYAAGGYVTPYSININAARPQGTLWFQLQSSDTMVVAFDSVEASYYGSTTQSTTKATARSRQIGTATVIVSAPGYEPDTIQVFAATPKVYASADLALQMFQEGARIYANVGDSTGAHQAYTSDTTTFTVTVVDTTIVRMDSMVVRVPTGQHMSVNLPIVPRNPGQTQVIFSAPGARPDTTVVTVSGVQVTIGTYRNQLGLNQANLTGYTVNIPTARSEPVVVHLESRHPEIATLSADSVIIPAWQKSATFGWSSGNTLGKDTIFISATGYAPDTLGIEVRTPKILPGGFYGIGSQVRTTQQGQTTQFGLGVDNDVNSVGHTTVPVTIYVASSDSSVMVPDSAAIHFQPGETYRQLPMRFINPGTAYLIYRDSAGAYIPDSTNNITVIAPEVSIRSVYGYGRLNLGMGQQTADSAVASNGSIQGGYFVTVADPVAGAPLVIDLASSDTSVVKLSASQVTIPVGATMAFVRITAQDTTGSIAIYATADGFLQGRLDVDVTKPALYVGVPGASPVPTDTAQRAYLYVATRAQAAGPDQAVSEDLVLHLSSSDPTVVSLDQATVTIPAGQRYVNLPILRYLKPGTATITATDPRTGFATYLTGSSSLTVSP